MSTRTKVLIKIAITISLLAFLAYRMDRDTFWNVLISASPMLVVAATLLHIASVFLSTTRWRVILESFDVRIPFAPLVKISFIGYFFNIFLPSGIGGDFFKAYYLARRVKRGMSTTLTTTMLERNAGMCALLAIGAFFSLLEDIRIFGIPPVLLFLAVIAAYALANLVLFHPWLHARIAAFLDKRDHHQLREKMELVYQGLTRLRRNPGSVAKALGISLIVQFVAVIIWWVAALAIDIDAPFLLFLIFVPLINLSIMIPFTINGMGLRESLAYLLFPIYGVSGEQAVVISLVVFVAYMLTAAPGAVVYSLHKKEEHLDDMLTEAESP